MCSHSHSPKPLRHLFSFLTNNIAQCLFPGASAPLAPIDGSSQDLVIRQNTSLRSSIDGTLIQPEEHAVCLQEEPLASEKGGQHQVTINLLPDDVLLEIFKLYVDGVYRVGAWQMLLHVCRRWRHIVFASPRRLNLRILCTNRRPVREMIDAWPALPIIIESHCGGSQLWDTTNIITALRHHRRVCKIAILSIPSPLLERFAAMKNPFPALTSLELSSKDQHAPVLPDSFLDGSAPRLRKLRLVHIPFPGLRRLLLSAPRLLTLHLLNIPDPGYTSPEEIVVCLSSLTRLRELWLEFRSPPSRPDQINRRPPPLTRTVLPVLTHLRFRGVSEYLEALISQIDVPLLNRADITFFNQLVFDTPLLSQFISRTDAFKAIHQADLIFFDNRAEVTLLEQEGTTRLVLGISCEPSDWQLSSLAQVCTSSLPSLSTLEHLRIHEDKDWRPSWQEDVENTQWLELFHPFFTVMNLYLDEYFAPRVSPTLQELDGERVTEVLPAVQNIFVEALQSSEPVREAIAQFVTARQLSGHPVAVHNWDKECWD